MIPQGGSIANIAIQERSQPSQTWLLDFERGKVVGKADGLEAVRQAAFKALQTDRFRYSIYSFDYGHELGSLIGDSPLYVQSEMSRMISEALLQDDRISSVEDLTVTHDEDSLNVQFAVMTEYGSFEEELNRNV